MTAKDSTPSARRIELLEACYGYVLERGLTDLSLRPLAAAVGSSPRVLLFLFDSKEGLIREILARARRDELAFLHRLGDDRPDLITVAERVWEWLADDGHSGLLRLWVEVFGRSLTEPDGPWAGFARATVDDWLTMFAASQPARERRTAAAAARRTAVLAVLRGALLDLLATGDRRRTTAAVHSTLAALRPVP
ncbi:MAG: TetR/AcrR family transcriptional regulator [Microlunatus sp.]|nr:TetR/AcrR family transcriptional regulator [Microlunatus sp.]